MASVGAIRDGLKARLDTISGLNTYDLVSGTITAPAAVVSRKRIQYDAAFSGDHHNMTFVVTLYIQATSIRSAQDALDAYLATTGAGSVSAAIEGDKTLGGIISYAVVIAAGEDELVEIGNVQYLAVDIEVGVMT
jgi:hypothetical protein